MTVELNVFNICKKPRDDEKVYEVNLVESTPFTPFNDKEDPLLLCLVAVGVENHIPSPEEGKMAEILDSSEVCKVNGWLPKF